MVKKNPAGILVFALVSLIFSSESERNIKQNEETALDSINSSRCQLTNEQMISDYEAMWKAMKESYPFWGVLSRYRQGNHASYDDVISKYRDKLKGIGEGNDNSIYDFLFIVAYSLYDVCGTVGHVSIINPDYFKNLAVYRKYADEMPEVKPWVDTINKPEVIAFYQYFEYLMTTMLDGTTNNEEGKDIFWNILFQCTEIPIIDYYYNRPPHFLVYKYCSPL